MSTTSESPGPVQYRYDLRVEIPATDVGVLVDALEDEAFTLRTVIGARELERQIREQELVVGVTTEERWPSFDKDVEILSVYLSQYILGREIVITPTQGAPKLEGWLVVGRRGETARVDLDLRWDADEEAVVDDGEDVARLAARWPTLPEWLRSSMRIKFPKLAAL
ncbi:MAG: hypothetical protein ABJE95_33610 [Byssovorax sp.]